MPLESLLPYAHSKQFRLDGPQQDRQDASQGRHCAKESRGALWLHEWDGLGLHANVGSEHSAIHSSSCEDRAAHAAKSVTPTAGWVIAL